MILPQQATNLLASSQSTLGRAASSLKPCDDRLVDGFHGAVFALSLSMQGRVVARLVAPLVCVSYVGYVCFDRFAYHEARKLELIEERRKAQAEAAARVAANPGGGLP